MGESPVGITGRGQSHACVLNSLSHWPPWEIYASLSTGTKAHRPSLRVHPAGDSCLQRVCTPVSRSTLWALATAFTKEVTEYSVWTLFWACRGQNCSQSCSPELTGSLWQCSVAAHSSWPGRDDACERFRSCSFPYVFFREYVLGECHKMYSLR